ncbi:MAG: rhodanese-like domain-containing protein [Eubacteriales bacterium]|nr:rhodanese-like domain-containing protein [Eubacteriales bacterium]
MRFEMVAPGELESFLEKPDVMLIDLRTSQEFTKMHIKTAVNIPFHELNSALLPMDATLLLYCERGGLSLNAARELAGIGYRVLSLAGGIHMCPRKMLVGY